MKFLIQMAFSAEATPEMIAPYQVPSAEALWNLYLGDTIREMYVRGDQRGIVFVAESADIAALTRAISEVPLVSAGIVSGEVVQLMPFPDLSLAFKA